jgi:hypothetical protein
MTVPIRPRRTCNWFATTGRFLYGLDGCTPCEFYETISGYRARGQNHPTIWRHSDGIEVIGRDCNNQPFKKLCKSIHEALRVWKKTFDMNMVSQRTDEEMKTLMKGYSYFSGADGKRGGKFSTIFAVNKDIYLMGVDKRNNKPCIKKCRSINEAVKLWKEVLIEIYSVKLERRIESIVKAKMGAYVKYITRFDSIFFISKHIALAVLQSIKNERLYEILYIFWEEKEKLYYKDIISVPEKICQLSLDIHRYKTKINKSTATITISFMFTGPCSLSQTTGDKIVLCHWHDVPLKLPLSCF